MPYLTPDTPTAPDTVWCLTFPNEAGIRELVAGALSELTCPRQFEQRGSMTPDEASFLFLEIFGTWKECKPLLIGEIVISGRDNDEDHRLLCDGRSIAAVDYPALFTAIGYKFGGSGGNFNIPDLLGRAPIGANISVGRPNLAVGQAVGAQTHQLTAAEMPSHAHAVNGIGLGPAQAGAGVLAYIFNPTGSTVTSSAGSGNAHNNMQPSLGVNFFIVCD